jgi:hypothetical protein
VLPRLRGEDLALNLREQLLCFKEGKSETAISPRSSRLLIFMMSRKNPYPRPLSPAAANFEIHPTPPGPRTGAKYLARIGIPSFAPVPSGWHQSWPSGGSRSGLRRPTGHRQPSDDRRVVSPTDHLLVDRDRFTDQLPRNLGRASTRGRIFRPADAGRNELAIATAGNRLNGDAECLAGLGQPLAPGSRDPRAPDPEATVGERAQNRDNGFHVMPVRWRDIDRRRDAVFVAGDIDLNAMDFSSATVSRGVRLSHGFDLMVGR